MDGAALLCSEQLLCSLGWRLLNARLTQRASIGEAMPTVTTAPSASLPDSAKLIAAAALAYLTGLAFWLALHEPLGGGRRNWRCDVRSAGRASLVGTGIWLEAAIAHTGPFRLGGR